MTDQKDEKNIVLSDMVLFDLIVFAFFLTLALISLDYNPRARSIPLGLGSIGATMMFFQLIVDAFPKVKTKLRFVSQSGILGTAKGASSKDSKLKSDKEGPTREALEVSEEKPNLLHEWGGVLRIIAWLVGFIILLSFVHYLIAVTAFIIGITRFEAGQSWKRALLVTICLDTSFFFLFDLLLNAQL